METQSRGIRDREFWKIITIEGVRSSYEISNHGRLRRGVDGRGVPAGMILKACLDKDGYHMAKLYFQSKYIYRKVHHLVAEAFIGPRPNPEIVINHMNGIKSDNYWENLEWVNVRSNNLHSWKMRKEALNKPQETI